MQTYRLILGVHHPPFSLKIVFHIQSRAYVWIHPDIFVKAALILVQIFKFMSRRMADATSFILVRLEIPFHWG